jgi:ABC-type transport system involved in multi-copper enzyme maturation permease subunit
MSRNWSSVLKGIIFKSISFLIITYCKEQNIGTQIQIGFGIIVIIGGNLNSMTVIC